MSDNWIRAGRAAVILVGLIVAAISYRHIRDLALQYGGDSITAPLLPLGIDGAVAAMTVFMHQATGLALWLSRFGLLVAIGMTVAFNTAYGAAFGVTGAVVWSSPAVLLVICIEVSVLTVRKSHPAAVQQAVPVSAAPAVATVPAVKPAAVPAKAAPRRTGITRPQQAAMLGLPERTLYNKLKSGELKLKPGELPDLAMANGNGKH